MILSKINTKFLHSLKNGVEGGFFSYILAVDLCNDHENKVGIHEEIGLIERLFRYIYFCKHDKNIVDLF